MIGIMQGRLSPMIDGRVQGFPVGAWLQEFAAAKAAGLDSIEWLYDARMPSKCPLWTQPEVIPELAERNGITVPSLCAHYVAECGLEDFEFQLDWLIPACGRAKIERLVIPFLEAARLTAMRITYVLKTMVRYQELLAAHKLRILLETDLEPGEFWVMLRDLPPEHFGVCYDTGNSARRGSRPAEDWGAYGPRIEEVHVKDVAREAVRVCELRMCGYVGPYVLESARGEPGYEHETAERNVEVLKAVLA